MEKCVIYTCIVGSYDELQQPAAVDPDFDFVCFVGKGEKSADRDGVWELREFDCGLDDVTVELCKYVLRMELAAKATNGEEAKKIMQMHLSFFRMDGTGDSRSMNFIYPEDGQMKNISIGFNVYEDCCGILSRNPGIKPSEGFEKVDSEWLSGFFR